MKKIIVLSGLPGSGKTWLRTHDERLKKLHFVDIAQFYWLHDDPMVTDEMIFEMFLARIFMLLRTDDELVVEASFLPRGRQRRRVESIAKENEWKLEYIEMPIVPKQVLIDRIQNHYLLMIGTPGKADDFFIKAKNYRDARLKMVNKLVKE